MHIFIYIYSDTLIIIISCIAKVVKLFLFLIVFATEKWFFWYDSYTKISTGHLLTRDTRLRRLWAKQTEEEEPTIMIE